MNDYLASKGYFTLITRIKRLSDKIQQSGRSFYKEMGMQIEPNWYLIFEVLREHEVMTVTEIAEKIKFSHPSVITITQKMIKAGYLTTTVNMSDSRKQDLCLSPKAIQEFPELNKVWKACLDAIEQIFDNTIFLKEFEKLEMAIEKRNFKDRVQRQLLLNEVELVFFKPQYAKAFAELNYQWIKTYFTPEPIDLEILDHPKKYILDQGGQILIALHKKNPIGVVSLIKETDEEIELGKMAVSPDYQGYGIGAKILEKAIETARGQGFKKVFLLSNTILVAAIKLYERFGFVEVSLGDSTEYKRANIKMELCL